MNASKLEKVSSIRIWIRRARPNNENFLVESRTDQRFVLWSCRLEYKQSSHTTKLQQPVSGLFQAMSNVFDGRFGAHRNRGFNQKKRTTRLIT